MPPAAPGTTGEPATAESLGWQLRSALPPMRLHSVSICNIEGDVLWLSEGALGPDEHTVLIEAIEALKDDTTLPYYECGLEDGRIAIFLAVRAPQGDLVGLAMILAELKSLQEGLVERIITPQVRTTLQKVAVLLRGKAPVTPVPPPAPAPQKPAAAVAPVRGPASPAPAPSGEEIELEDYSGIDTIITLELVDDQAAPIAAPARPQNAVKANSALATAAALSLVSDDVPVAKPAKPAPAPEKEVSPLDIDALLSGDPEPRAAAPAAKAKAAPAARPAPAPAAKAAPQKPAAPVAPAAQAQAPSARKPAPAPAPVVQPESEDEATVEAEALIEIDPPSAATDAASDLALHVQQLIKLRSNGRTRRFEVLARSRRDPAVNQVPPAFIAESSRGREGAVLDGIVAQRLLAWLSENRSVWSSEPASFSINLSIGALEDENFAQRLASWLSVSGVKPECLGFEITEFAVVQCRKPVQRFVEACEKLGCFLVLDNFSMDSAALPLLGSRAMKLVKIDPKLTSAAMKDKLSQALVVAICQACKVLGLHCVAKRVESQTALQWLTAVGCDFAQGFVLEKPAPIETIVAKK